MRIETDDWMTVAEAAGEVGIDPNVARRLARDLGLSQMFFGVLVIKRADVATLKAKRRKPGNPQWIESYDAAAEAAVKAVAARTKNRRARP